MMAGRTQIIRLDFENISQGFKSCTWSFSLDIRSGPWLIALFSLVRPFCQPGSVSKLQAVREGLYSVMRLMVCTTMASFYFSVSATSFPTVQCNVNPRSKLSCFHTKPMVIFRLGVVTPTRCECWDWRDTSGSTSK